MNITISGLTAAGKTTHALLVARWLGYDYVSASALMFRRLGIENGDSNTFWQTQLREVEKLRDEQPVDRDLNEHLTEELGRRDNTVFDSWSAPWLPGGPDCVRVFIESDLRSRTLKARVSQEPHGPFLSLPECRELIEEKDEAAAARLGYLLGVDILRDRSPFDLVLSNSALIREPAIDEARRGIGLFHNRLITAIADQLSARADSDTVKIDN
jgi:cytidylate kinase